MLQYVNRFHLAVVGNRSEVVLNFLQDRPVFSPSQKPDGSEGLDFSPASELIGEYALTKEVAMELIEKLNELLANDS